MLLLWALGAIGIPTTGLSAADLDSLYCRIQTSMEESIGFVAIKEADRAWQGFSSIIAEIPKESRIDFRRLRGECHFFLGMLEYQRAELEASRIHLHLADSIISGIDKSGSDLLAKIKRQRGIAAYFREENPSKAKVFFEASLQEWFRMPQKDSSEIAITLVYYGQAASRLGEYEKGLDLYQQALSIREAIFGRHNRKTGMVYFNIGVTFYSMNRYEEAREAYESCLEIIRAAKDQIPEVLGALLSNLAATYDQLEQYEKSIRYYKETEKVQMRAFGKDSERLIPTYSNMALVYGKIGKLRHAHEYLTKAFRLAEISGIDRGFLFSELKFDEAFLAQLEHSPWKTLRLVQEAIHAIAPTANREDWRHSPSAGHTLEPVFLQQITLFKANLLRQIGDTSRIARQCIVSALESYELAAALGDRLRLEYDDESDKLSINREGQEGYRDAIDCAHRLWMDTGDEKYASAAFRFMERNKFQLLLESFKHSKSSYFRQSDEDAFSRLDNLRRHIAELDYLVSEPGISRDSQSVIQKELIEQRIMLKSMQDSLSRESPEFRSLIGDAPRLEMTAAQKGLTFKNDGLLEYFYSDSLLFAMMLLPDTVSFRKTVLPQGFADSVNVWLELCRKPVPGPFAAARFARLGYELFQLLLEPEDRAAGGEIGKLTIIPDGILSDLPFEALVMKPVDHSTSNFGNMPYLLYKYRIQFAGSSTLLAGQTAGRGLHRDVKCLGFAWGNPEEIHTRSLHAASLPSLPGTVQELLGIESEVAGRFLHGDLATEAEFKQHAPKYGILHLALHATAGDGEPRILFPAGGENEDGILHFHELYRMRLTARLAVLSSCQTGTGQFEAGEGIQSMASGFSAAGVPSLLMSLWEIDDKASCTIMRLFYLGLLQGKPVDESLRAAKLEYLQKAPESKKAPFFWSAFTAIGDMESIDIQAAKHNRGLGLAGATAFVTCMLLIFFLWKSKHARKKSHKIHP